MDRTYNVAVLVGGLRKDSINRKVPTRSWRWHTRS
jgi:hypothetical protein